MAALQALAAASLPQEVGSSAAQHLLQQATLQAEKVFQGQRFPVCLAEDATDMDDWLIWQHFHASAGHHTSSICRQSLPAAGHIQGPPRQGGLNARFGHRAGKGPRLPAALFCPAVS